MTQPIDESDSSTSKIKYAYDFYGCSEEVAQKLAEKYDRQLARNGAFGKPPCALPCITSRLRVFGGSAL